MSKFISRLACASLMLWLITTSTAQAEINVGVAAGPIDIDVPELDSDFGVNVNFTADWQFLDLKIIKLGVEGLASVSIVDGELDNNDASFDAIGGFVTARTGGRFYLVAKAGYQFIEIQSEAGNYEDDGLNSFSAGIGYTLFDVKNEILVTRFEIEDDNLDDDIEVTQLTYGIRF